MRDEKSLSVYTTKIREAVERVPQEIMDMSEVVLRKEIDPSLRMYELRRAFWEELAAAQEGVGRTINVTRIIEGKYSKGYFYQQILPNHYKLAWLMHPLVAYEDKTKAALDRVTERYDELINMEITSTKQIKNKETGEWDTVTETDPKKALVLLQVMKNLEDRIKGTSIQRQVSISADKPENKKAKLDMKAVENRLKELEGKLGPSLDYNGGKDEGQDICDELVKDSREAKERAAENVGRGNVSVQEDRAPETIELESGSYKEV